MEFLLFQAKVFFEGRFSGEYSFNHILFMVSSFLPGPGPLVSKRLTRVFLYCIWIYPPTDRATGAPCRIPLKRAQNNIFYKCMHVVHIEQLYYNYIFIVGYHF